ncbi:TPA: glycosyltransferase family 2 protein, partial [Klebsiella pneumoniae]|nr:glycosyltransferase family 2 protein [Klebsiella pneumoniae]
MKISFVIPAYNAEGYIHECISSILNQGEDGFEIIVINDGSTDRTEEILNQIKSQTTKLTFHTIDNSGQSIARNLGVQYAKGEYIFFIDADDLISPKTIKKLHDIIENECADIVFFNGSAFYDDDQLKSAHSFNYTRNSKYYN